MIFYALVRAAHERGMALGIFINLGYGHEQFPAFLKACDDVRSGVDSPEARWFVWSETGTDVMEKPLAPYFLQDSHGNWRWSRARWQVFLGQVGGRARRLPPAAVQLWRPRLAGRGAAHPALLAQHRHRRRGSRRRQLVYRLRLGDRAGQHDRCDPRLPQSAQPSRGLRRVSRRPGALDQPGRLQLYDGLCAEPVVGARRYYPRRRAERRPAPDRGGAARLSRPGSGGGRDLLCRAAQDARRAPGGAAPRRGDDRHGRRAVARPRRQAGQRCQRSSDSSW